MQLKSFFMVACLGSITLAAEQLGLSQPIVTSQICALEETYGAGLFYHGGRRLTLSDTGVRLMSLVNQLVRQETEIDFFLRNSGDMDSGHLRIGTTAPYYALDIADRFCKSHPGIDVSIEAGNSVQMLEALQEYRVDVASSSQRVDDARFLHTELARDPLVLVVHRNHALANRTSVSVSALSQCRLLVYEVGSTTRAMAGTMMAQADVTPASTVEIGSRESIREAIMHNLGVSIIARQEVPSHADLRVLPFEGGAPELSKYSYCLRDRCGARLIAAFLSEVRPVSSQTGPKSGNARIGVFGITTTKGTCRLVTVTTVFATACTPIPLPQPVTSPTSGSAVPFLSVQHISHRFGAFAALGGVSLDVTQGELVCLLGPSGYGRTTPPRIIVGLEAHDGGRTIAGGRDTSNLPPRERDHGTVFQSYTLFPDLTVAQNVGYGLDTSNGNRARIQAHASEMLTLVGLAGSEAKYPPQLSGGQQQRMALARALTPASSLLLLDKPILALDTQVREHLHIELRRLQRKLNVTTLMVTYDQDEVTAMADHIAIMSNGRIEQTGSPTEIYSHPVTALIAGFVGQTNWLPLKRVEDGLPTLTSQPLLLGLAFADSTSAPDRLFCRPEAVTLHPDDDAPNRHLARVVDQIYLGNRTRVTLSIDGLADAPLVTEVISSALRAGRNGLGDSKLWVALERDGLHIYA